MYQNQFVKKNSTNILKISMFAILTLTIFISIFVYAIQYQKQQQIQQQLAEKVIRFHVLANSDSEEDQALKLCVRDAIGTYMQNELPASDSKENCKEQILERLDEIEQVAGEVITGKGYDYLVTASLEECDFPVKTYGEYTFPAGTYEALRVVIGEGEGANWWCVMYPNMCFENSMYEVVDEKAEKALLKVLDEEEYEAVLSSGKYEIRFRFLEWFR